MMFVSKIILAMMNFDILQKIMKLSYKKKCCEVSHICKRIHSWRWILPLTSVQNFNEIIQIRGTTKQTLNLCSFWQINNQLQLSQRSSSQNPWIVRPSLNLRTMYPNKVSDLWTIWIPSKQLVRNEKQMIHLRCHVISSQMCPLPTLENMS